MLTSRKAEASVQYLLTGFFRQSLNALKNLIKTGVLSISSSNSFN